MEFFPRRNHGEYGLEGVGRIESLHPRYGGIVNFELLVVIGSRYIPLSVR